MASVGGFHFVFDKGEVKIVRGNFNEFDTVPFANVPFQLVSFGAGHVFRLCRNEMAVGAEVLRSLEFEGDVGVGIPPIEFEAATRVRVKEPLVAGIIAAVTIVDDQIEDAFHQPFSVQVNFTADMGQLGNNASFNFRRHPRNDEAPSVASGLFHRVHPPVTDKAVGCPACGFPGHVQPSGVGPHRGQRMVAHVHVIANVEMDKVPRCDDVSRRFAVYDAA